MDEPRDEVDPGFRPRVRPGCAVQEPYRLKLRIMRHRLEQNMLLVNKALRRLSKKAGYGDEVRKKTSVPVRCWVMGLERKPSWRSLVQRSCNSLGSMLAVRCIGRSF